MQKELGGYALEEKVIRDINEEREATTTLEAELESARADTDTAYSYDETYKIYSEFPEIAEAVRDICPAIQIRCALRDNNSPILFGNYVQQEDGKTEPIEWIVLSREGDKVLLISLYALDC